MGAMLPKWTKNILLKREKFILLSPISFSFYFRLFGVIFIFTTPSLLRLSPTPLSTKRCRRVFTMYVSVRKPLFEISPSGQRVPNPIFHSLSLRPVNAGIDVEYTCSLWDEGSVRLWYDAPSLFERFLTFRNNLLSSNSRAKCPLFLNIPTFKDEATALAWKVLNPLTRNAASYPRKTDASATPLWRRKTSHSMTSTFHTVFKRPNHPVVWRNIIVQFKSHF
jgi:hypothetical protein